MSTKAIREALDWLENYLGNEPEAQEARRAARAEVEAIERAAKDLTRLYVGDGVYRVRDMEHVIRGTPIGSSTWEHPDVKAWSDASVLLANIAKQEP